MVKVKGLIGRFWFGVGGGTLSGIVVVIIGLRAMQSSTVFFSAPLRVRSVFTPANPATDRASMASSSGPKWAQKTITLPPQRRGCHLITPKVSLFVVFVSIRSDSQLMNSIWVFIVCVCVFETDIEGNWARLVRFQLWSCSCLL